jgi:hypothetical protein
MAISSLSDDHHAVRHVSYQQIDRDDVTGAIRGIFPQAFELLPKDDGYLSASWLGFFRQLAYLLPGRYCRVPRKNPQCNSEAGIRVRPCRGYQGSMQ